MNKVCLNHPHEQMRLNFKNNKPRSLWTGLFIALAFCVFLSGCGKKAPEILSIEPHLGRMGDILTIRGLNFGNEKDESFITIAGTPPISSSYVSWSDEEILVRIPEFGDAGLIYVHRGRKKSNPAMFANLGTMPLPINTESGNLPEIISVEPPSGAIGQLITIHGDNFGATRGSSGVFFSWDAEIPMNVPIGVYPPDFIEALETEFAYELWSEREIRLRVPDGAASGSMEVRTPRGTSRQVYFEVTGKPGIKIYRDKKSYTFSYMADMQIEKAVLPNSLYVWMPLPAVSASQRNIQLISRSIEPFIENYRGTSLFQFVNTVPKNSLIITLSYKADVYIVETNVRNQTPIRLNSPPPAKVMYVLPSALVPSNDPRIKTQAESIIARERLPYAMANRIYDWLLSAGGIGTAPLSGGALEALEEKSADSYRASLLFCALARAVNIPAIPVAGVLLNQQGIATRHYWAEFWIDGFGWIPLDPALGAAAAPADFNLRQDHSRYYFGNIDNQRITFSRGENLIHQMTPQGRTTMRSREYSLQNLWEEASGGLESYSSLWSGVTITGIYAQ